MCFKADETDKYFKLGPVYIYFPINWMNPETQDQKQLNVSLYCFMGGIISRPYWVHTVVTSIKVLEYHHNNAYFHHTVTFFIPS